MSLPNGPTKHCPRGVPRHSGANGSGTEPWRAARPSDSRPSVRTLDAEVGRRSVATVVRLSLLAASAMLAASAIIAQAAQAGALAEERVPARSANRGGVVAVASELPADGADAAPASCPYHFRSDMPAATFCVYRGVALGGGGELCATDVVVIWSSLVAAVNAQRGERTSASDREVYLGFVADPDLVVRAIADPRQGDRAEMVGYTLGREDAPLPLAGQMTLRAERQGAADVLRVDLSEPLRRHPGSCALASYAGTFLGVIRPPSEATVSADPFIVPRQ